MGISAVCDSCGKKYQAADRMAGKRIKCRNCGAAILLPGGVADSTSPSDSGDANWELGTSFLGGDDTQAPQMEANFGQRDGNNRSDEQGGDAHSEDHADAPPRKRSEWYRHPTVRIADRWLPPAGALIGLLGIAYSSYSANAGENMPFWSFGTRMAVIVFSYVVIAAPLSFVGIRYSVKSMGAILPRDGRWRAFTAYVWALLIAVLIWNAGGGGTPALIMGTTLGLAISAGVLMILFRFEPDEIGPAAMYASLGFVFGAFFCGMAVWGANVGTMRAMSGSKTALPASPYFSYMTWEQAAAPVAPSKPKQPASKPATTTKPADNTPTAPPPEKVVTTIPVGLNVETVLRPVGVPDKMLVVRNRESARALVELWDPTTGSSLASATLPVASQEIRSHDAFALSPDGGRVVHYATFPQSGIYVQHLFEGRSEFITAVARDAVPQFLGFYGTNRVLYRVNRASGANGSVTTHIVEVDLAGRAIKGAWSLGVALPSEGYNLRVDESGRIVAFVYRSYDGEHRISFVDLNTPSTLTTDPSVSNYRAINLSSEYKIAPTGLAFSSDRQFVTVHYEQDVQGVVYNFRFDGRLTDVGFCTIPASTLTPNDKKNLQGSTLSWFPSGDAWLVNGDAVIDIKSGRTISRLGISSVINQRFVAPDTVEVLVDNQGRRLQQVKLNLPGLAGNNASGPK